MGVITRRRSYALVVKRSQCFIPLIQNNNKTGKIMERKISGRKLSSDMQRKLSAISNCSDVSNLSVVLGMDPNDFKSTIQNILELDIGEDWVDSEDESELGDYATETYRLKLLTKPNVNK